MLRRGVELDADVVHAAHDHVIERALERGLIDVVLILPDADALRIELHEFGERVHETPADRHRAAHGDVLVGKFLARDIARRVDRRAAFAHHHDRDRRGQPELADECLRLAEAVPLPMAMASILNFFTTAFTNSTARRARARLSPDR
jgi:hypothetical protein